MSRSKTTALPQFKTEGNGMSKEPCSLGIACHETIRESAYFKWMAAGCPCCDGVEFWLKAEAELTADPTSVHEVSKS